MRARLAPMLYDETDHEAAAAMRASIVAKAERSDAAKRKQTTGRTDDGLPVHSFQSLLADLATPSCDTAELSPGRAVGLYEASGVKSFFRGAFRLDNFPTAFTQGWRMR